MKPRLIWAALAAIAVSSGAGAVPTKLSAEAGEVRDIVNVTGSATVLYAATQGGGVYKSIDAGATWSPTGLTTGYAWKIAISDVDPTNTLYVATDAGLFRSTNAGTSWTQLTFDPARAVAVDPNSTGSDRILLGVTGTGVLRSTDGGTTWTRQSGGLDSTDVTQIFIKTTPSGEAYVALNCNSEDGRPPFKEGNWGGVFRTTNLAAATVAWTSFNTSLPSKCVRGLTGTASTARVLVGIQDPFDGQGKLYRSDGGAWSEAHDLFGVESLAPSAASATTFHAGSRALGVFTSTNSGDTWVQKSNSATDVVLRARSYAIGTIAGSTGTVIASAKGLGLMRTTNYTAGSPTWAAVSGLRADRVRALDHTRDTLPNAYWAGLEGGGVVKSANAGGTWSPFLTNLDFGFANLEATPTVNAIAADPSNPNVVLAGVRGFGLFNLKSDGSAWDTQPGTSNRPNLPASVTSTTVDYKPQYLAIPLASTVFYTLFDGVSSVAGGLLRSTTGPSGLAQTAYPADILNCTLGTAQSGATKVLFLPGASYLLRHDSSLPYRSTDLFASSSSTCVNTVHEGYERVTYFDMAQRSGSNTVVAATSKGIFRSTDNGLNFGRVAVTGLTSTVLSAVAYNGTILYGVDRGGGFYCSTDDGTTWQNAALGSLARVAFRDMKLMNGSLHVLTDGAGIYNGFAATCP